MIAVVTGYPKYSLTTIRMLKVVAMAPAMKTMIQQILLILDVLAFPALLTPLMLVSCQNASHVVQRTFQADIFRYSLLIILLYVYIHTTQDSYK